MSLPKFLQCWQTRVPPTWLVFVALIVVQIGFGLYPVVIKKFADTPDEKADPLVLSFYRDLFCSPVLFLCAIIAERKLLLPSWRMLIVFLMTGLMGMFGNQCLYILGVYWAGPNASSAFQPIIPVWTAILALISCTEKPSSPRKLPLWLKFLGILLAAGGAIEITLTKTTGSGSGSADSHFKETLGYIALFGNTLCMAVYVLIQKRFIFNKADCKFREYPVLVTAYSYVFGAVFMGLATLYYAVHDRSKFVIPSQSVYVLIYAVFISSALCYLLITWANLHISSIIVTAFWPVQVLIAVVASWYILGEKLATLQYIGAVMLIFGLVFVLWSTYEEGLAEEGKKGFLGHFTIDCDLHTRDRESSDEEKSLLNHSASLKSSKSPSPPPAYSAINVSNTPSAPEKPA